MRSQPQSSHPSAITPQAVGTHADLPSESSFVGTSPLRMMSDATRVASLFSTACSSRSSLLPQSWLCGAHPEDHGAGQPQTPPHYPWQGLQTLTSAPGHLPGACLWLQALGWGRGRRAGRSRGQWG